MILTILLSVIVISLIIYVLLFMKPRCPDCGGKMYESFYDSTLDGTVWKCSDCGEEWV